MASPTLLALAAALQALASGPTPGEPAPTPGPPPATARVHDGSERDLEVPSPFVADPEIRVDGRSDEAAWERAALLRGFTQFEPVEGVPASQRTEVRVLLGSDALYFHVTAFDDAPGGIRASMAQRDGFGRSDDWVRVVLDTFDDRRRAFVFQVNPYGVQADGLWVEGQGGRGGPIDWNPDFLWASAGRVAEDRWVAEMRVPLKSLRFPDAPLQDWGLQVMRRIQRNGYEASWAPLTSDRANRLAQSGRLRGLRDLDPGMFLEINPVVTGGRTGEWDEELGRLRHETPAPEVGVNVTYGLTSNLTLDGTVNPDFSQIEADAGQITVNERFAIRLPEKRPFFLEGTDVFRLPAQLVYTRRVANPVAAAKVSGKVGSTGVAWIGAVDEGGEAGNPVVNLVRIRRDLGASSTLGLVYTDRTRPGEDFNRVGGLDGRFVLGGRYTLDVLSAVSADGAAGADTDWGSLVVARVGRSGRRLSVSAELEDVTPDFRARSGFIRRVGVTDAEVRTRYTFRGGRGALVESWGPSFELGGTWARPEFWRGAGPEEGRVEVGLSGSLRGNVGGFVSWSRSMFSVPSSDYEGLFVVDGGGEPVTAFRPSMDRFAALDRVSLRSWISRWERVRVSLGASWSETPVFERAYGLPAEVGTAWSGDVDVTFRLTGSFSAELGGRHARIVRPGDGSTYSTATIPRLRARYQLDRALFARLSAEYALQERAAVRDPATGLSLARCDEEGCAVQRGSDRYDVRVDALLGYEPSPGTVFFLGYSREMRDSLGFRFRDTTPRAEGLFAKASYRFRM